MFMRNGQWSICRIFSEIPYFGMSSLVLVYYYSEVKEKAKEGVMEQLIYAVGFWKSTWTFESYKISNR